MKIKHQFLVWLMVASCLVTSTFALSFPDVNEEADYAEAVNLVSDLEIFIGDNVGNFNPDNPVTRAEMATVICRMLRETNDLPTGDTFSDVPENHWANPYVNRAAELEIVNGYGDGRFGPGDTVTYEQAVTMLVRAVYGSSAANELGGYPDGFLSVAKDHGLLECVEIEKGHKMSRAEIAVLVYNYYTFWEY